MEILSLEAKNNLIWHVDAQIAVWIVPIITGFQKLLAD